MFPSIRPVNNLENERDVSVQGTSSGRNAWACVPLLFHKTSGKSFNLCRLSSGNNSHYPTDR